MHADITDDLNRPIVFTLDLEDHLGSYKPNARFVGNAVAILDLLDSLQVHGTFFVVGRVAETHPAVLVQTKGWASWFQCSTKWEIARSSWATLSANRLVVPWR